MSEADQKLFEINYKVGEIATLLNVTIEMQKATGEIPKSSWLSISERLAMSKKEMDDFMEEQKGKGLFI